MMHMSKKQVCQVIEILNEFIPEQDMNLNEIDKFSLTVLCLLNPNIPQNFVDQYRECPEYFKDSPIRETLEKLTAYNDMVIAEGIETVCDAITDNILKKATEPNDVTQFILDYVTRYSTVSDTDARLKYHDRETVVLMEKENKLGELENAYFACSAKYGNLLRHMPDVETIEATASLLKLDKCIVLDAFKKAYDHLSDSCYLCFDSKLDYAVADIVEHFLKKNGCKSVYDPDARHCSLLNPLTGKYSLFASNLDIVSHVINEIDKNDVYSDADAVVTFVDDISRFGETDYLCYSIRKSLGMQDRARTIIAIMETGWLTNIGSFGDNEQEQEEKELILQYRCDVFDMVETIIELPADSHGHKYSIIVLNPANSPKSVRMVNATEMLKDGLLDSEAVIKAITADERRFIETYYKTGTLRAAMPTFMAPHFWAPITDAGETRFSIGSLLKEYSSDSIVITSSDHKGVDLESVLDFNPKASNIYDLLMGHRSTDSANNRFTSFVSGNSGSEKLKKLEAPVIELTSYPAVHYFNGNGTAYCFGRAFQTTDKVTLEYMAYALMKHQFISRPFNIIDSRTGYYLSDKTSLMLQMPVVVPDSIDEQRQTVESALQAETQKRYTEMMANMERCGIRAAGADILHMLGAPFNRQGTIIQLLKTDCSDDKRKKYTDALIDVSEYIQRIVTTVGTDISKAEPNKAMIDLKQFVSHYSDSYRNFGSGCFELIVAESDSDLEVCTDADLLKLLLDTILDNATRHGFGKNYKTENRVEILLQPVRYDNRQFAMMTVRNNGQPLSENFKLSDYISKGRFDGESGRTGLGGFHVYTIAKKHNGFLSISSDDSWGMIVDILIPLESKNETERFVTYEKECV